MFPVVLTLTTKEPLTVASEVVVKLAAASTEVLLPANNTLIGNVVISAREATWRSWDHVTLFSKMQKIK